MDVPNVSWGWLGDRDCTVWGPDWEFSQDTGVNTPTLTISAMGSLVTTESQDTRLTSHVKDGNLYRAMSPITGLVHWDILDQRKGCLLLNLQHHFQQHLVSHPGQPCLASEASQWDAGWYAAGMLVISEPVIRVHDWFQHWPQINVLGSYPLSDTQL